MASAWKVATTKMLAVPSAALPLFKQLLQQRHSRLECISSRLVVAPNDTYHPSLDSTHCCNARNDVREDRVPWQIQTLVDSYIRQPCICRAIASVGRQTQSPKAVPFRHSQLPLRHCISPTKLRVPPAAQSFILHTDGGKRHCLGVAHRHLFWKAHR